ncbi:MAG: macro domain-containing protein [Clostridiaceae bacterium]|nr:macro domain-containing protein [Clostridiaceae bacterium]
MPFTIVRQDITKFKVDAVANAANIDLQQGGGVCGAIYKAAGARELEAACNLLAPIRTGEAVITKGFSLPAKHIIHAAGPVYHGGTRGEEALLRAAYLNSLKCALENDCNSIAFPLISSGIYGYPKEEALRVATEAIRDFLSEHDMDVFLAVFDKDAFQISEKLLGEVASYIDEHYVEQRTDRRRTYQDREDLFDVELKSLNAWRPFSLPDASAPTSDLDAVIEHLDEPFSTTILRLIDAKGKDDVQVYKKANIDRKLFSKIRTGNGYTPSKRTVLALAVGLELSLEETGSLLRCAGYALSGSSKFDVIVEYFIFHRRYDIFEINQVLFQYDQPLLGG